MTNSMTRMALVGMGAGLLAACQSMSPQYAPSAGDRPTMSDAQPPRPAYPTRRGRAGAERGASTTAVESAPLPKLPDAPIPYSEIRREPAARPAPRQVTRTTVTGKVVDAAGKPRTYVVKKGDNLDAIARDMGTSRKQLADDNDLEPPYRLRPGQRLQGPSVKAKAYVVTSGDTLFAISERFGVSAPSIADANDIAMSSTLHVGQRLILPKGFTDKGPIRRTYTPEPAPLPPPPPPPPPSAEKTPYRPPVYSNKATSEPAKPEPSTPPPTPSTPATPSKTIIPSSPNPSDNEISVAAKGRFIWPLRGDIISEFGPKGGGQRNDGVNIKAAPAQVVRAAAAGEIVYAGDQVPGFGNLVLIKHADGWVTAYAHLAKISVQMRQHVAQGAEIGQAGMSGGVAEPQLHFEVRYAPTPQDRAKPVDPKLVLPK